MKVRITFIILVISWLLFLPSISGQEDQEPNDLPEPVISFEFNDDEYHVDVEPGRVGIGEISGKCHCTIPSEADSNVMVKTFFSLQMENYSLSNPARTFFTKKQSSQNFYTAFFIPVQSEQNDGLVFELNVHWEYEGANGSGVSGPFYTIVIIDQYSKVTLGIDAVTRRIPVGEWEDVTLKIINFGNGPDQFNIEVTPVSDLVEAKLSNSTVNVGYQQEKEFTLKVRQKSGYPGSHEVRLEAWSNIKGSENSTKLTIPFRTTHSYRSISTSPFCLSIIGLIMLLVIIIAWLFSYKRYFSIINEE